MVRNEVVDNMMTRRSVRSFTDEPVDAEAVKTLLDVAMAAPSSMALRPWHFVVIESKDTKELLKQSLPYAKMINEACVCIVVCGDTSLYDHINHVDKEDNTLYWVEDCSAASENILLAAHSLGLGAVWTGIYPLESRVAVLRDILNIPDRIVPLNLIVIGHYDSKRPIKDRWDTKKVHYEKF